MNKLSLSFIVAVIPLISTYAADDLRTRLFDRPMPSLQAQIGAEPAASPVILDSRSDKQISRGGAMLRSLIIPGWGESYLGYHKTARYFFWTDVALWASVIGLEVYSHWKEDQFITFAATHADAQMEGKSERFYADIGNYSDTEAYNEARLRNRDFDALYTDPAYFWAWDSDQNRLDYDHIRIQSRSAHNKIYFFIGAAALNRLISLIDAGKKARDLLKSQQSVKIGFHLQPDRSGADNSLRLVVSADF